MPAGTGTYLGHMVYLIDDEYLFTGDTIWFGRDGGYSFLSTLAEDNDLSLRSLAKLKKDITDRKGTIKVITGHTGWSEDLNMVFKHCDRKCTPFLRHYEDPEAPYDGYIEDDDTKQNAQNIYLKEKTFD